METTKTLNVRAEKIDPSIENANPENCNLSILFKQDGLIFSILRNDVGKYIVLGEYTIQDSPHALTELFSFYNQFTDKFLNVNLAYSGSKFALVPATLFRSGEASTYVQPQFEVAADEVLRVDELPTHQLVVIYAVPRNVAEFAAANFGPQVLKHSAYFAISYYLDAYKNKPGEHFHINLWHKRIEVIAVRNGRLLFCSQFDFESDEDVAYYVLNCYEQLALNPETVPLKISGELEKGTAIWELLEKYIRFVEAEAKPVGQYSHEFKSLSNHRYNRIFQTAQCAS